MSLKTLFSTFLTVVCSWNRDNLKFRLFYMFLTQLFSSPSSTGPQTASIEYEIKSSQLNGANDKIKFDILTPSISINENMSNMPSSANNTTFNWPKENFEDSIDSQLIYKQCQQPSSDNGEVISISVELNQIGNEIDKRINKKTKKILDVVQELLKSQITKQEFFTRMNETAKTSIGDLIIIAKKLVKRYKFGHNPNSKEFSKLKNLQFPTAPRDLSKFFSQSCNDNQMD